MKKEEIMEQPALSPQEEKEIANKAKKRVRFKIHITIYILICLLLWIFWNFILKGGSSSQSAFNAFLFITLVWGICIIAHYLLVYKWNKTYVEKEIKSLKEQREKEKKQKQKEEHSKEDK